MEVTYIQHCGTDVVIANAARVSFAKKTAPAPDGGALAKDARLIQFLAREKHLSPFNHTFITLHVKAPLFVARQLVKHEYMPWNEVSGRYVTFDAEFADLTLREKTSDKKQGSGPAFEGMEQEMLSAFFDDAFQEAHRNYLAALELGVCEEQARTLLPLGLMTEWYWSGTLGAWAKMFNLRAMADAQKEAQEVAFAAGEIIAPLFPEAWKALTNQ